MLFDLPPPPLEQVSIEQEIVYELGKDEILSLPWHITTQYVVDRYWKGYFDSCTYYGANPETLTAEESQYAATILLHASESNQGQWLPFLHSLYDYREETNHKCPVFTFNYTEESDSAPIEALINKIREVKKIYRAAGKEHVHINLVGHSLGGIIALEYLTDEDLHVCDTSIDKVVTIASRIRNLKEPQNTPYYAYAYPTLVKIEPLWEKLQAYDGPAELFQIAAGSDWLVPEYSVLFGDEEHTLIIPDRGHALVAHSHQTRNQIIGWLYQS